MTRSTRPGWFVYDVHGEVGARTIDAMPELPPEIEADVEALWQAAQVRTGGVLFNGRVFSADTITPTGLAGHMTEYRRIVAQVSRPTLYAALKLRPLAVCGVVRCIDGVVLGRRSLQAGYQPGIWQLPPAGNVDAGTMGADGTIDLKRQMLRELEEELGVEPGHVVSMRPLCLVEHADSHILDLGYLLDIRLDAIGLLAAHAGAKDAAEYDPLTVVPWEELKHRMTELGEQLMPTAWEFLRRLSADQVAP